MGNGNKSFWITVQGILAGLACLTTAGIALLTFRGIGDEVKQKPPVIQSETDPMESYTRIPKAGIKGHNTWKLKNVGVEDCARKCNEDSSCKSFDYHRIDRHCYGSDMTTDDVGGFKTTYKDHSYDHYLKK